MICPSLNVNIVAACFLGNASILFCLEAQLDTFEYQKEGDGLGAAGRDHHQFNFSSWHRKPDRRTPNAMPCMRFGQAELQGSVDIFSQ